MLSAAVVLLLGLGSVSAAPAAPAPPPPAPPGWSLYPGHCMGNTGCDAGHCNCQGDFLDGDGDFDAALAHCKRVPECKSFAISHSRNGYELYPWTNWSAVPNHDWTAYATDSAIKPPSPPPRPAPSPRPKPASSVPPNLHEVECAVHAFAYEFGTERVPKATTALHDALNLEDCKSAEHVAQIRAATARADAAAARAPQESAALHAAASVVHVATTGSDATGKGTAAAPFASLGKAQLAARSAPKPCT
jgi:hypothetical protein